MRSGDSIRGHAMGWFLTRSNVRVTLPLISSATPHAARLALALRGVAVAGEEVGAVDGDREVDGVTGLHVGHVHVAAVGERGQGRQRLQPGRGAHRAHERRRGNGELRRVVGKGPVGLASIDPDLLGQRILQRRRKDGRRQPAEVGLEAADGEVTGELDVLDPHREHVAGFGALDDDRPGLRVEVGAEDIARHLALVGEPPFEGILGIDGDGLAGRHRGQRLVVFAHHVGIGLAGMDLSHGRPPDLAGRVPGA